jgi:hypothetical protein
LEGVGKKREREAQKKSVPWYIDQINAQENDETARLTLRV